ncbi:hypothetical protein [Rhizobium sp. 768_B6_N1_8]|uniref:hypothetical protein n=1 Tax=unclassified Rhizobium TaxID=2613769 RepID=UPI003F1ECFD6
MNGRFAVDAVPFASGATGLRVRGGACWHNPGGLGNATALANLPQIQGELGLTPIEGAWLPAAWVKVNVSSNLILFKCRQQFGIRRFAELGLMAYVLATVLQLAAHNYSMTLFVHYPQSLPNWALRKLLGVVFGSFRSFFGKSGRALQS